MGFLQIVGILLMIISVVCLFFIVLSIPYAMAGILYALPLYAIFIIGFVGAFRLGMRLYKGKYSGKEDEDSNETEPVIYHQTEPVKPAQRQPVKEPVKEDSSGLFTAYLLKTGNEKVKTIKYIRELTNCSLPDAKRIADETGRIASTSDKNKALIWYYMFAETDSIVQVTNLYTYGCFKVECKKPEDESFTVFKDHIGKMQAEAEVLNYSQTGYTSRVIKEEIIGNETLDLKTLPKIESKMVVIIMRDMLGYSNEQLEKLIREDDLVVKGID